MRASRQGHEVRVLVHDRTDKVTGTRTGTRVEDVKEERLVVVVIVLGELAFEFESIDQLVDRELVAVPDERGMAVPRLRARDVSELNNLDGTVDHSVGDERTARARRLFGEKSE